MHRWLITVTAACAAAAPLLAQPVSAQPGSVRLQIERAAAKYLRADSIGWQQVQARSQFVPREIEYRLRRGELRSDSAAKLIAADMGLAATDAEPGMMRCVGMPMDTKCTSLGITSFVAMSVPVINGDSAVVAMSFWPAAVPGDSVRFSSVAPNAWVWYTLVRGQADSWRVVQVRRESK